MTLEVIVQRKVDWVTDLAMDIRPVLEGAADDLCVEKLPGQFYNRIRTHLMSLGFSVGCGCWKTLNGWHGVSVFIHNKLRVGTIRLDWDMQLKVRATFK